MNQMRQILNITNNEFSFFLAEQFHKSDCHPSTDEIVLNAVTSDVAFTGIDQLSQKMAANIIFSFSFTRNYLLTM